MKRATLMTAAFALLLGGVGQARAGFIVTFSESNGNVVANGTGSMNISGLSVDSNGNGLKPIIVPNAGDILIGQPNQNFTSYSVSFTKSSSFGTSGFTFASSGTGDIVGVQPDNFPQDIVVPANYTSGSTLTSSATWDNTTISQLGLTPGTYTWTWGSGANADSFEVIVPSATTAVPEPSTLTLLGFGSLSLLGYGWRRRKQVVA
jgi:hypothetical protein